MGKMQSFRMLKRVGHTEPLAFERVSRTPQNSAAQTIESINGGLEILLKTKILFSHHDIYVA
jgi:hypothetical protein